MRKFMVIAIPLIALSIFIIIMLSGDFFKKPHSNNDNIPKTIEEIIEAINTDDWQSAGTKTNELDLIWKKVVKRVQFSSERDEINFFSMNVARLHGAIMARDKAGALSELNEAYEHWKGLGK